MIVVDPTCDAVGYDFMIDAIHEDNKLWEYRKKYKHRNTDTKRKEKYKNVLSMGHVMLEPSLHWCQCCLEAWINHHQGLLKLCIQNILWGFQNHHQLGESKRKFNAYRSLIGSRWSPTTKPPSVHNAAAVDNNPSPSWSLLWQTPSMWSIQCSIHQASISALTSLLLTYLSRGDGRSMLVCGTGQWKIKMPIKNLHNDLPHKRRKHKHWKPPFIFKAPASNTKHEGWDGDVSILGNVESG